MKRYLFYILIIFLTYSCEKKVNPLVGQKANDFELKNASNQTIKFSEYKKQKIMLHFWADWCASCREEFFTLQNVHDKIQLNNATVIGLNVGQTKEHVQELIDEYDVTFPMLRDETKKISEMYNVRSLPMNFFISTSGKIYKIVTGWMEKDKILEIIQEMD